MMATLRLSVAILEMTLTDRCSFNNLNVEEAESLMRFQPSSEQKPNWEGASLSLLTRGSKAGRESRLADLWSWSRAAVLSGCNGAQEEDSHSADSSGRGMS